MILCALITLSAAILPGQSRAATNDSADGTSALGLPSDNRTSGVDADDILTNNNLRAASGAKTKWSFAGNLNYSGGTVGQPFGEDRPNISAGGGNTTKTDIDGTLSIKYNLNSLHSLFLGFGARYIAPFTRGAVGPDQRGNPYEGARSDAYNPSLTYQYIYKYSGVQAVFTTSFMQWTQTDQTAVGYARSYSVNQENVYEVPNTNLSVGASVGFSFNDFDKEDPGAIAGDFNSYNQSLLQLWLSPYAEYSLTEKINLRTVLNIFSYEHWRMDPATKFRLDKGTQSVGVGFSVTRDLFLYPNVQFLPDNFNASNTNVAIGCTVNL